MTFIIGTSVLKSMFTVFDLITAPALITAPLPFYFIFTYRRLNDLFLDCLPYFHLLSPTWRSFSTSERQQIYVSAPGAYEVEYGISFVPAAQKMLTNNSSLR